LIVQTIAACMLLAGVLVGECTPDCKPVALRAEDFKPCGNMGFKMDSSRLKLTKVPSEFPPAKEFPGQPLCVLDLGKNDLIRLRPNAFNSLRINASEIQNSWTCKNKSTIYQT